MSDKDEILYEGSITIMEISEMRSRSEPLDTFPISNMDLKRLASKANVSLTPAAYPALRGLLLAIADQIVSDVVRVTEKRDRTIRVADIRVVIPLRDPTTDD